MIEVYYHVNKNFMANQLVFTDFPSLVHTHFYDVIYTAISDICSESMFLRYSKVNILAWFFNKKWILSVLIQNFIVSRLVFLDFLHTNFHDVIYTTIQILYVLIRRA